MPLAHQIERIQQICAGRIDPPLMITIEELLDPSKPTHGLLVIHVPCSPQAPHQVDGRYLGRADRVVRTLTDSEVVRLHHLRQVEQDLTARELEKAQQDAIASGIDQPSLMVAITPTPVRRQELLRDELASSTWNTWLAGITQTAEQRARNLNATSPVASLVYSQRGFPYQSRHGVTVPGGRSFQHHDRDGCQLTLEVFESGKTILVAQGVVGSFNTWPGGEETEKVFDHEVAATYTFLALSVFSALADHSGFMGTIGVGVLIDNLRGARPPQNPHRFRSSSTPYRDASYRQITSATTVELSGDLTGVMDRLFGQLLRSLGLGDPLR